MMFLNYLMAYMILCAVSAMATIVFAALWGFTTMEDVDEIRRE